MSLAIKENNLAVSELKLPSPSDLCLGQISVKNCKNATIGTKIDGNVIVNQYFNDIPADKAAGNGNGIPFTDSVVLEDWTQKILKYKYIWLSLILAVVITTVICIVYIPQNHPHNDNEDVQHSMNYTLKLMTRYNWSKFRVKLKDCDTLKIRPAKYVVIGHTVSRTCNTPDVCESIMTNTQSDHIRRGFCDIGYNFVIGDDGYIYEGRGWGIYGAHTVGFNCDSIGVGLIGEFNKDIPSSDMFEMLGLLIDEGLRINEISQEFKLIFQSQVNQKPSPGVNVEKVLKKWDHWSEITKKDRLC